MESMPHKVLKGSHDIWLETAWNVHNMKITFKEFCLKLKSVVELNVGIKLLINTKELKHPGC